MTTTSQLDAQQTSRWFLAAVANFLQSSTGLERLERAIKDALPEKRFSLPKFWSQRVMKSFSLLA